MALLSRELYFIIMLGTSVAIGIIVRMLGHFRFKKEFLSLVGLIQMIWLCQWDTLHLVVLMTVCTAIIQTKMFGPRVIFIYCFLHRIFFSSSEYFGLERDESNLANAALFITSLKMVIVAYEVADYRAMKNNPDPKNPPKTKWVNLDTEPSAFDILCYITCFVGFFTGPVFRYKTYHDMLHKYLNVPCKNALISRLISCGIACLYWTIVPFNFKSFNDFDEYNYFVRLPLMVVISLTQVAKYAVAWLLAECVCVLIGLGAYPVSTDPVPGLGPTKLPEKTINSWSCDYNYETVTTMNLWEVVKAPTMKETAQKWNMCTQWWLACFIYSSTVFPRKWRVIRVFNVMIISAIWHGIKPGYFMSFPVFAVCFYAEDLWTRYYWPPSSKFAYYINQMFHWLFFKMFLQNYFMIIFILQDYNSIIRFAKSTYFYGYLVPIFAFLTGLMLNFFFPKPKPKVS